MKSLRNPVLSRVALHVLMALMALSLSAAHAATITGSGRPATESRALSGFQAVSLRGPIRLVVRQAGRETVSVRADDNLLPLIETRLDGRTLEIGIRPGESLRTRAEMIVTVEVVQLEALAGAGSGDIVVDGLKTTGLSLSLTGSGSARLRALDTDALVLAITGSGDADIAGRATRLEVAIAGSGDVMARDLASDDVTVSIRGSGDARVQALRRLVVSIAGSGDVTYSGNVTPVTSLAGSGRVSKR